MISEIDPSTHGSWMFCSFNTHEEECSRVRCRIFFVRCMTFGIRSTEMLEWPRPVQEHCERMLCYSDTDFASCPGSGISGRSGLAKI